MLEVEFAQLSDRGRVREGNEDYLGHVAPPTTAEARTHGWLFALADGVGGHDHGEVASRTAVETLLGQFRQAAAGEAHGSLLPRLVQAANAKVFETGLATHHNGNSMATTLVSCALRYDRAVVAHVGDSRCYLVRRGQASLLTRDHTMANEQVRMGLMSSKEAGPEALRHVLSRSLGAELFVNAEISDNQILPGDVLVLCSDGLHGAVQGSEIAAVAGRQENLQKAAERLVAIANERDGSDNISVQLIRIVGVERVGMYRGRPYKLH